MLLYHRTSDTIALALAANPKQVSVTVGGGELGRGFYAGDSLALAAAWARRRGTKHGVLEIDISNSAYAALSIHTLNATQVVSTWNQLKASKTTRTHVFGWDVVHGPLATMQHASQHKFESSAAESVLHASGWLKL